MPHRLQHAIRAACAVVLIATACRSENEFAEGADARQSAAQPLPRSPVQLVDSMNRPLEERGRQNGVTLTEWLIEPDYTGMPAGTITLRVRNRGTRPHVLRIEGAGVDQRTDAVQPGREILMTLSLPAGQYTLSCPQEDDAGAHRALGMQRIVVVQ